MPPNDRPSIIRLRPSRRLALALAAAHLAAAGAIAAAGLPLWITLAAAAGLIAHGTIVIARVAMQRAPSAVVALEAGPGASAPFQTRDGAWHEGQVLGSTYVGPAITVLEIREAGRRGARQVLIVPDAIDAADFRRLRVWLRWGGPKSR